MLPKIPYKMEKNKSVSVPIGNLNLSCNFKPGDIAASRGISARKFPYLTTKKKDAQQGGYSDVLAMTVFNGKLVTVRDEGDGISGLYTENERLCGLSGTQERQFAAINTKLVIMPDGVYIENGPDGMRVRSLSAEIDISTAIFSSSSVQSMGVKEKVASGYGYELANRVFRVKASADITLEGRYLIERRTGRYQISPLRRLPENAPPPYFVYNFEDPNACTLHTAYMTLDNYNKVAAYQFTALYFECGASPYRFEISDVRTTSIDDLDVPLYSLVFTGRCTTVSSLFKENGNTCTGIYYATDNKVTFDDAPQPDISSIFKNADGQYITVQHKSGYLSGYMYVSSATGMIYIYHPTNKFDDYICDGGGLNIKLFGWSSLETANFDVGDSIMFSGIDDVIFRVENKNVTSVTVSSESEYENCSWDAASIGEIYKVSTSGQLFSSLKVGDAVEISGCSLEENNMTFVISDIQGDTLYASSDIFTEGASETNVTVTRRVPRLDFVCEKDNRLYGVSNADKTIYVSALGDPTNMYVYSGLSTDSFAVPVGGEGNFTGCCKYSDGVLFFKEDKIYKLVGSYPADFALYSYDVDGLQKGAHKSMAVINEVLYYKGKDGIFSYTGGIPTLISENFGEHVFSGAVASSDGVCYYVSMTEGDVNYLMAYNTRLGLWVLEDDVHCIDFARTSRGLFCATEEGEVYLMNATEDASNLEWFVQFVPFYETIEGKKIYSRLLLRVELPEGSYMIIEVRSDGGLWREAGKIVGKKQDVVPISIPINRCDKFEIRLRGKGPCTILSMLREFSVGSDM